MSRYRVTPLQNRLKGEIQIPSSKSHSLRAVLFGAMAHGQTAIQEPLPSPDLETMIQACRLLGAQIEWRNREIVIQGVGGKPQLPEEIIHAGNSGLVLRLVGAVSALCEGDVVLTGDHSICTMRLVQPLIDGLNQLGATAFSTRGNGLAPLVIRGPLSPGRAAIQGEDSQPVSGLLIAAAFLNGTTELSVHHSGETPWIEMTLYWLKRLGLHVVNEEYCRYWVHGPLRYNGFQYTVPGDFSSAAFPLAAAVISDSEMRLCNLDMEDPQGDKRLISILQQMGANIEINTASRNISVKKGGSLKGVTIDVNDCIDALPILAVIGCFAEGETRLVNGAIARRKECDRIASICSELRKLGADIQETEDGLIIRRSDLRGASAHSHCDHRIAMSLAIAGLAAQGETQIDEVECVNKTYPGFHEAINRLGAEIVHER